MSKRLIRNAARCRLCNTTVESKSVHDWRGCACGAMFVDGGREYARWGGNPDEVEDLCEYGEANERQNS